MSDRKVPSRIGRFEIKKELGRGAFGTVYLAVDPQLERPVALKVPHFGVDEQPKSITRFLREAKAAAGLHHPNIVAVHDAGRHDENFYIASAFVDGSSLREKMKADGKPSKRAAVKLVAKLANALGYANEQGVVHRDVKPENILLQNDGVPFLVDFGLARRDSVDVLQTQDGTVLGTPAYMSPEQASGHGSSADGRTDQWSLGVILYELLTGVRPFAGNQVQIMYAIQHAEVASPRSIDPTIPLDLEIICLRCLSKDPKDRFPDNYELGRDLERWLNDEPIASRRLSMAERFSRWNRRNPTVARLSLALVASISLLGTGATIQWLRAEWNAAQARYSLAENIAQRKKLEEQSETISKRSSELEGRNQELIGKNEALQQAKEEIAQSLLNLQKKEEVIQMTSQEKEVAVETAKIASAESAAEKQQRIEEQSKNRKLRYFGEIQSARLAIASGDASQALQTLEKTEPNLRSTEWSVLRRDVSKYQKGFVPYAPNQETDPVGFRFMESVHFPELAVEPKQIEELCKAENILEIDKSATRWTSRGVSVDLLKPFIPSDDSNNLTSKPSRLEGQFIATDVHCISLRQSANNFSETVTHAWLSPNGRYIACIIPKTTGVAQVYPPSRYAVAVTYRICVFDLDSKDYFEKKLVYDSFPATTIGFEPSEVRYFDVEQKITVTKIVWDAFVEGDPFLYGMDGGFSDDSSCFLLFQRNSRRLTVWSTQDQSGLPSKSILLPSLSNVNIVALRFLDGSLRIACPGQMVSVDVKSLDVIEQKKLDWPVMPSDGVCFSRDGRLLCLAQFSKGKKVGDEKMDLHVFDCETETWQICNSRVSDVKESVRRSNRYRTPADRVYAASQGLYQADFDLADIVGDRAGRWLSFRHRNGAQFQYSRSTESQFDKGEIVWNNRTEKEPVAFASTVDSRMIAVGFSDRLTVLQADKTNANWKTIATKQFVGGELKELAWHSSRNSLFVSQSNQLSQFDPIQKQFSTLLMDRNTSCITQMPTGLILCVDSLGQVIIASSGDGTIQKTISVQRRGTPAIAVDVSDRFLAAAGEDRRISLWDMQELKIVGSVISDAPIQKLVCNPKSQLVAALGFNQTITVFKWPSFEQVVSLSPSDEKVLWFDTTADGKRLLVGTRRGMSLVDLEFGIGVLDVLQFAIPSKHLIIDGNQEVAISYDEEHNLTRFDL